jgi:prophage DNA circulation protein
MSQITIISEKDVEVVQSVVQFVDEVNSLTAVQKEAMDAVFDDVKDAVHGIMNHEDLPIQIKIMKMISFIIKSVQDVCAARSALTGADKKAIAMECGRKCIKMMMKDHLDMLMLYDTIAEPALETMLDLSRKIRPVRLEAPSQSCIGGLFQACMSTQRR